MQIRSLGIAKGIAVKRMFQITGHEETICKQVVSQFFETNIPELVGPAACGRELQINPGAWVQDNLNPCCMTSHSTIYYPNKSWT